MAQPLPVTTARPPLSAELYMEIQQFYAEQMQCLDSGEVTGWAATFTVDGVFAANAAPEPVRGRAAIAAVAGRVAADLAARGITRRHWLGMVAVQPRSAGVVHARCYALVIFTPQGGKPEINCSTSCEDVLVRSAGGWQVAHRQVSRDDIAGPAAG